CVDAEHLGISLDETVELGDLETLLGVVAEGSGLPRVGLDEADAAHTGIPDGLRRKSAILQHPQFSRVQSETDMLRYLRSLADKDLALDRTMIPLGSCTMK